jgi:hypothetical protein
MPLIRTVGRTAVIAGTASAVGGRVNRRQQRRFADQDSAAAYEQQQAAAAQAQAPPPPAPEGTSMDDKVSALQDLAKLKEQGILTEEEFAAQKAKILGS